jgi:hypothetical protein
MLATERSSRGLGQTTRWKACELGTIPNGVRSTQCYGAGHDVPACILVHSLRTRRGAPAGRRVRRGGSHDGRRRLHGRAIRGCRDGNRCCGPFPDGSPFEPRFQRHQSSRSSARCLPLWLRSHASAERRSPACRPSGAVACRQWRADRGCLRPAAVRLPPTAELSTRALVSVARKAHGLSGPPVSCLEDRPCRASSLLFQSLSLR